MVGPTRRRRLLPGDVHRRPARLRPHGRPPPARLGDDDRAPQGDRPSTAPGAGAPSRATSCREAVAPQQTGGIGDLDGEVWTAVAGLPEGQRAAVALRYAADLAYREIGAALGLQRGGGPAAGRGRPRDAARDHRPRGGEAMSRVDAKRIAQGARRRGGRRGSGRGGAAVRRARRPRGPGRGRVRAASTRRSASAGWRRPSAGIVSVGLPNMRRGDVPRTSSRERLAADPRAARSASTRRGASSTSTSTARGTSSTSSSTGAWSAGASTGRVLRETAKLPVRGHRELRRDRRQGRQPARLPGRRHARSATTRSRSSSPVIASCAPAACSATTAAGRR